MVVKLRAEKKFRFFVVMYSLTKVKWKPLNLFCLRVSEMKFWSKAKAKDTPNKTESQKSWSFIQKKTVNH
jgi:hypothetical protein